MKRTHTIAGLFVAIAMVVAACGSGDSDTSKKAADEVTVLIGPSIHSVAIMMATDQGYYEDEGL